MTSNYPGAGMTQSKMELQGVFGRFSHWKIVHTLPGGGTFDAWMLALTDDTEPIPVASVLCEPITLRKAVHLLEEYIGRRMAEEPHFCDVYRTVAERTPPELERMQKGWAERRARLDSVAQGLEELRAMLHEQDRD